MHRAVLELYLRKWPSFDQFGPPRPETRVLSVKTGDSGLESKTILILDRKLAERHGGQNARPTTVRPPNPASKQGGKVRDHGVPQDPVFG